MKKLKMVGVLAIAALAFGIGMIAPPEYHSFQWAVHDLNLHSSHGYEVPSWQYAGDVDGFCYARTNWEGNC